MTADGAFDAFVDAEMSRLLGLAYALTANPHDAWDLVQETLTRVGSRWSRIGAEQPSAYARTVLVRLNIDRLRRLRREFPVVGVREAEAPVVEVGSVEPWLLTALTKLSDRQRTAIALRYVEDLDVLEISRRMGCSNGTARSHLSRGLKRLRQEAGALELTSLKESE